MVGAEHDDEPLEPFEPLPEGRLAALPNAKLVDYIGAAREAGDMAQARKASGILAFAFEPTIRAWVRRDMGSRGDEDVEDVVMDVLASVVHSSFDGKVVGEFGSFLKTITRRRVVDHFRRSERHGRDAPLPNEHLGQEELWGDELGNPDDTDSVARRDAVERVLATRNAMHTKVIRLYGPGYLGFCDLTAEEAADEICNDESGDSVTEGNVHQIWKRFKTDLARELDLDG